MDSERNEIVRQKQTRREALLDSLHSNARSPSPLFICLCFVSAFYPDNVLAARGRAEIYARCPQVSSLSDAIEKVDTMLAGERSLKSFFR